MSGLWQRPCQEDAFSCFLPFRSKEKQPAGSRGHRMLWKLSRAWRVRRAGELLRKSLEGTYLPLVGSSLPSAGKTLHTHSREEKRRMKGTALGTSSTSPRGRKFSKAVQVAVMAHKDLILQNNFSISETRVL